MASDARDILGDAAFKAKKEIFKKNSNKKRKRPEGMSLEVYGLLSTSSQDPSSLVPTMCSNGGYKERARLSGKKTREWKLTEFENSARSDGLKLTHWAVKAQLKNIHFFHQNLRFWFKFWSQIKTSKWWSKIKILIKVKIGVIIEIMVSQFAFNFNPILIFHQIKFWTQFSISWP